jgi:hypothetical protein
VNVEEGAVLRFTLPIPADAVPACETRVGRIAQVVILRVDGSSAACGVPIVVGNFAKRAARDEEDDDPPELVGRVRWRFAWRDEGARHGLALEGRELRLRGTLAGAVDVKVKPHGVGVTATLRWPTLGIGLRIEKRGLFPLTGVDLHDVDPSFSNRFVARGREEAQVRAACGDDLRNALLTFDEVELDDAGARITSNAAARDAADLRNFLDKLEKLADAVVAAEARVPPPAWATEASVAAWRAFAESTGGRFHAGRLAITGALFDGDRARIETDFDGAAPSATRVELTVDPEIDRDIPASAEAELLRAAAPATKAEVRADAIVLTFAGALADPSRARAALAEAQRLARRLRGETARGPYR